MTSTARAVTPAALPALKSAENFPPPEPDPLSRGDLPKKTAIRICTKAAAAIRLHTIIACDAVCSTHAYYRAHARGLGPLTFLEDTGMSPDRVRLDSCGRRATWPRGAYPTRIAWLSFAPRGGMRETSSALLAAWSQVFVKGGTMLRKTPPTTLYYPAARARARVFFEPPGGK